jgi:hypothetical protein
MPVSEPGYCPRGLSEARVFCPLGEEEHGRDAGHWLRAACLWGTATSASSSPHNHRRASVHCVCWRRWVRAPCRPLCGPHRGHPRAPDAAPRPRALRGGLLGRRPHRCGSCVGKTSAPRGSTAATPNASRALYSRASISQPSFTRSSGPPVAARCAVTNVGRSRGSVVRYQPLPGMRAAGHPAWGHRRHERNMNALFRES